MSQLQYTIVVSVTPQRANECLIQFGAFASDDTTALNQRLLILGFDIALLGAIPATAPPAFDFTLQSNIGVPAAATTVTPQKAIRGDNETIQGRYKRYDAPANGSTDPAVVADSVLWNGSLHRQGTLLWRPPISFSPITVMGGERVGFRYLDAALTSLIVTLFLEQ